LAFSPASDSSVMHAVGSIDSAITGLIIIAGRRPGHGDMA
jgi:hypothetical protein